MLLQWRVTRPQRPLRWPPPSSGPRGGEMPSLPFFTLSPAEQGWQPLEGTWAGGLGARHTLLLQHWQLLARQPWTPDQDPQEDPLQLPCCTASAALSLTVSRGLLGLHPSPSCAAAWAWSSLALLIKSICSALKNGPESPCSRRGYVRGRAVHRLYCVRRARNPAGQRRGCAGWVRAPPAWRPFPRAETGIKWGLALPGRMGQLVCPSLTKLLPPPRLGVHHWRGLRAQQVLPVFQLRVLLPAVPGPADSECAQTPRGSSTWAMGAEARAPGGGGQQPTVLSWASRKPPKGPQHVHTWKSQSMVPGRADSWGDQEAVCRHAATLPA